jgi:hypothetical protein
MDMQSLMAGKMLSTTVTALEADGDAVTFACTTEIDESLWILDANSGEFLFAPTAAEAGVARFDFTATDKDGTSETVAMNVMVTPPPAMATFEPSVNGSAAAATISTEAGQFYVLQYTTNLTNNPIVWHDADIVEGTGDELLLQDTNTPDMTNGVQRFYRIVIP